MKSLSRRGGKRSLQDPRQVGAGVLGLLGGWVFGAQRPEFSCLDVGEREAFWGRENWTPGPDSGKSWKKVAGSLNRSK